MEDTVEIPRFSSSAVWEVVEIGESLPSESAHPDVRHGTRLGVSSCRCGVGTTRSRCGVRDSSKHRYLRSSSSRGDPTGADLGQVVDRPVVVVRRQMQVVEKTAGNTLLRWSISLSCRSCWIHRRRLWKQSRFHSCRFWTTLFTCPVFMQRRVSMVRFRSCNSSARSSTSLSWRRGRSLVDVCEFRALHLSARWRRRNCGGGRDRNASSCRIRTTHVRLGTRLSRRPRVWALAPLRKVALTDIVEVIEIGALLLAESAPPMFVTAPVLEAPPVVVEQVQKAPFVV